MRELKDKSLKKIQEISSYIRYGAADLSLRLKQSMVEQAGGQQ